MRPPGRRPHEKECLRIVAGNSFALKCEKDVGVPTAGSEQMYQALSSLGVPAELVVYPGEHHSLDRPSFLVDRSRRYLEWMSRYIGDATRVTQESRYRPRS